MPYIVVKSKSSISYNSTSFPDTLSHFSLCYYHFLIQEDLVLCHIIVSNQLSSFLKSRTMHLQHLKQRRSQKKTKIVGCLWGRDCLGSSDSLFLSWDKRRISTFFRKMQKCMFTLQLFSAINHLNL